MVDGRVTTRFLDEAHVPADPAIAAPIAAAAWASVRAISRFDNSPFTQLGAFRITPHRSTLPVIVCSVDGELHHVDVDTIAGSDAGGARIDQHDRAVTVVVDGYPHHFSVPTRSEIWAGEGSRGAAHGDAVAAPFPGTIAEVHVEPGQTVVAGDPCIVIEAMKMLHTLASPVDATVAEVAVSVGDQVASHQTLVTFEDTP